MANFGFKYLKTNLIENAAMGVSSKVHGYHPVASYAVGNEFGDMNIILKMSHVCILREPPHASTRATMFISGSHLPI